MNLGQQWHLSMCNSYHHNLQSTRSLALHPLLSTCHNSRSLVIELFGKPYEYASSWKKSGMLTFVVGFADEITELLTPEISRTIYELRHAENCPDIHYLLSTTSHLNPSLDTFFFPSLELARAFLHYHIFPTCQSDQPSQENDSRFQKCDASTIQSLAIGGLKK